MRAEAQGAAGQQWLAGLDERVRHLQRQWQIQVGAVLSGGSESLVAGVRLADGGAAILKIGLPGSSDLATEAQVLALAGGRGYARLLAHDADQNALLLERLGLSLRATVNSVETQIRILCRTLHEAWIPLDAPQGLMTGAEKATWLAAFIREGWQTLGQPCDAKTIDRALHFVADRVAAYDPAQCVLVHGDAHADNALTVGGDRLRYKFVDPDGLFAEKACDLAVPMREWSEELLAGDTLRLAQTRCDLLAELTGVAARAIWQWGFIERVSTGLVLLQIGLKHEGVATLAVADQIRDT
jgi:streptomycin 6-kinase